MIRGTTAQFKFKMPYSIKDVSALKSTFWQENYNGPSKSRVLPIIKTMNQCILNIFNNEILVSLDTEETSRFKDDRKAYVQLRGKTVNGSTFGSKRGLVPVYPGDDSILDDNITPTPTPEDSGLIILDGNAVNHDTDNGILVFDGPDII